LQLLFWGLP